MHGMSAFHMMSKNAFLGLTDTNALEYVQHGIRVNAIAPARVETEVTATFHAQHGEATQPKLSQDNPLEKFHGQTIQAADVAEIETF